MLNQLIIVFVVFLKFATPVVILRFPFFAGWFNFVLDTIDGDILIPLGLSNLHYQPIDKIADWATYAGMVFVAWKFRWEIRKWIYRLFALRSIGQLAFLIFSDERIFFYFPNFLEPLFLIYATISFFKKNKVNEFYNKHRLAIWIFVILYKMQDEYFTHIANLDRSDLLQNIFKNIF